MSPHVEQFNQKFPCGMNATTRNQVRRLKNALNTAEEIRLSIQQKAEVGSNGAQAEIARYRNHVCMMIAPNHKVSPKLYTPPVLDTENREE